MDSDEEDYYQDGGSDWEEEEADESDNNELDFAAATECRLGNYKILTAEDIKHLQENDISKVSDTLSVPRGVACTLLCRNYWNINAAYDQWFAAGSNTDPQPAAAGSAHRESGQKACNICYDDITSQNTASAACGHPFCTGCWKTYLATAINDGPRCLTLPCPEPGCKAAVGPDMVESLASAAARDKYYEYLRRSYVESSRRRKWCPAPGCVFALEFDSDGGGGGYDVTCGCSHKFCWNCAAEHHRPVSCETVARWTEKNNSDGENTKWIIAYTKPCPKCRRPIEKNQGCSHMRCRSPCNFYFCWLCGKSLDSHSRCNNFSLEREMKEKDKESLEREKAKKHLLRYTHYYERWHSNEKSIKMAMADLRRWREERISKLAKIQGEAECQLQFVMEAWEQIVECRRVLKWSYAYGYYMEGESLEKTGFFEYLQGEAETVLEKLHHCAEKEVEEYLALYKKKFKDFRSKLSSLTRVTKNYFENLVKALEDNLDEVESCGGNGGMNLVKNVGLGLKSDERPRKRATIGLKSDERPRKRANTNDGG